MLEQEGRSNIWELGNKLKGGTSRGEDCHKVAKSLNIPQYSDLTAWSMIMCRSWCRRVPHLLDPPSDTILSMFTRGFNR